MNHRILYLALAAALISLASPARAAAPVPACRLSTDQGLNALVAAMAQQMLLSLPEAPLRSVLVNPQERRAGALHLLLISDAAQGAVDARGCPTARRLAATRDPLSVPGLCAVEDNEPDVIRCSADGLDALTAEDRRRGRASPALLYVLAHELAHLLRKDKGSFLSADVAIPLAAPAQAKWERIARTCGLRTAGDQAVLDEERRADAVAQQVLLARIGAWAQAASGVDPAAQRSLAILQIWVASAAIQRWQAGWHGGRGARALEEAPAAPSAAYIEWAVDRTVCDVLEGREGALRVPAFNARHPLESERLAAVSLGLYRSGPRFRSIPGAPDNEVQRLTAELGGINAVIDAQQQAFMQGFRSALCERVQRDARPDCARVAAHAPPPPPPQCPRFDGQLSEEEVVLAPTQVAVQRAADRLLIEGGVRIAIPLPNGDVWATLEQPRAVVRIAASGAVAGWSLPCTPGRALANAGGVSLLCDRPLGLVQLDGTGRARVRRLTSGSYDEEALREGDLRGGWLGLVEGQAHATVHLPQAGKSTTVVFAADGVHTAAPYLAPGCDRLHAGAGLWRVGGQLYGTNWDTRASRFLFQVAPSGQGLTAFVVPPHDRQVVACGPGPDALLCADRQGAVYAPIGRGGGVHRFTLPRSPIVAEARDGRICSAGGAAYLLLRGPSGAEIFVAMGDKRVHPLLRDGSERADLGCGPSEAVAVFSRGERSELIPLRPPPPAATER